MGWIKITESDFLPVDASVEFVDGIFQYRPKSNKNSLIQAQASDIKFMNRQQSSKIKGTNTNIFKNVFIGGAAFAFAMEFIGLPKSKAKADRRIRVRFNDGRLIAGLTDLDTFFEVQNVWLDSKPSVNIIEKELS